MEQMIDNSIYLSIHPSIYSIQKSKNLGFTKKNINSSKTLKIGAKAQKMQFCISCRYPVRAWKGGL